jgi:hypothetical protein
VRLAWLVRIGDRLGTPRAVGISFGREADHSPPSSAEVKEWVELYVYSPNTPSWRGGQLGGTHRGKVRLF